MIQPAAIPAKCMAKGEMVEYHPVPDREPDAQTTDVLDWSDPHADPLLHEICEKLECSLNDLLVIQPERKTLQDHMREPRGIVLVWDLRRHP